jgi:tight adherence protein C
MLIVVIAGIALAVGAYLAGEAVTYPARERRALVRRAAHYGAAAANSYASPEQRLSLRERIFVPLAGSVAALMLRLNRHESVDRVQLRLAAAGMGSVSARTFLAAKGLLAAAGLLVGTILWATTGGVTGVFLLLGLVAGGYIFPGYFVGVRTRKRRDEMQRSLPDALDLLAVTVEAGLGFDAAILKLTEHMRGPLIDEFAIALGETRVGQSRHDALKKLAARVDAPDVTAFVRAILQADQLGTALAKTLRIQAIDARLKRQAAAEERAMKAPIKMLFPTVLFIFPAMFIVILGPAMINLGKLFGF